MFKCIMVAVLVVDHSKDLTPNHIFEVYITPLPNHNSLQCSDKDCGARNLIYPLVPFLKVAFTKDLRLIPCKQQGHSPLLFFPCIIIPRAHGPYPL